MLAPPQIEEHREREEKGGQDLQEVGTSDTEAAACSRFTCQYLGRCRIAENLGSPSDSHIFIFSRADATSPPSLITEKLRVPRLLSSAGDPWAHHFHDLEVTLGLGPG